jgi:hypothetical protein
MAGAGGSKKTTINNIGGDIAESLSTTLLQAISGGSSNFFWGSGVDGTVTLAVNTTLAAADNIKQYTTLTINDGVILRSNVADYYLNIYASIALVMGAGAQIRSDMGGGGLGGSFAGSGGGFGGTGGNASGTVAVYARSLTMGAGSRIGGGWDGGNGLNGGATISNASGGDGAAADAPIAAARSFSSLLGGSIGNTAVNGSGSFATIPGVGSATGGALLQPAGVIPTVKDPLLWIHRTGKIGQAAGYESLHCQSTPCPGAGQGKDSGSAGAAQAGAGGQGSGAASWLGTGGDGGGQTGMANNAAPTGLATGGGAGAGGAPGCVTVVICGSFSGSGTISSAGGNGGNGGNGNPGGTSPNNKNSGGAGGGGGPGGVLVVWGPSALSGATLTAAGGTGGSVGISFGGGPALVGTSGSAGYSHIQKG